MLELPIKENTTTVRKKAMVYSSLTMDQDTLENSKMAFIMEKVSLHGQTAECIKANGRTI